MRDGNTQKYRKEETKQMGQKETNNKVKRETDRYKGSIKRLKNTLKDSTSIANFVIMSQGRVFPSRTHNHLPLLHCYLILLSFNLAVFHVVSFWLLPAAVLANEFMLLIISLSFL